MHIDVVLDALARGCCLEVHDGHDWLTLDPQVVGFDRSERPMVLGVERSDEQSAPLAKWLLLRLDRARSVGVSGYLSDGARAESQTSVGSFARILGHVAAAA